MIKRLLFGRGEITDRMYLEDVWVRWEFKVQDMWVGAFWKRIGNCVDIWVCVLPCVPLHITLLYHDPEQ